MGARPPRVVEFVDPRIARLIAVVRRWVRRSTQAASCPADPEIQADAERLGAEVDRLAEDVIQWPPPLSAGPKGGAA